MDGAEWGPWIEHDGKGCPCVGVPCEVIFRWGSSELGDETPGSIPHKPGPSWFWVLKHGAPICIDAKYPPIIRYRIRKPKGLAILERLLRELPAIPARETVPFRGSIS